MTEEKQYLVNYQIKANHRHFSSSGSDGVFHAYFSVVKMSAFYILYRGANTATCIPPTFSLVKMCL